MEVSKESLKLCQSGYPTLLVMSLPSEVLADDSFAEAFCLPIAIRPGGILLALPDEAVGPQAYAPNEALDADLMVGAVKRIEVALIEEGEGEVLGPTGVFQGVVVLDFADDILPFLREYDPSKDHETWITPFNSSKPTALPDPGALHELSLKWIASQAESSRVHFYSAQEDLEDPKAKSPVLLASTKKSVPPKRVTNTAIMDQLAMIGEQMKLLASRQDMVEQSMRSGGAAGDVQEKAFGKPPQVRLSDALVGKATEDGVPTMHPAKKAAMLSGPPPKVRAAAREVVAAGPVPGDPFHTEEPVMMPQQEFANALMQQSSAITALVAHLANQSDPLSELSSSSSGGGGTKGVQRRERLQSELAARSGGFFLALMQQVHRRMNPGKPLPKSEADLAGTSLWAYLERHGGYRGQRDLGLIMWIAAHIVDCLSSDDVAGAKEHVALLIVSLEQAAADGGWGIAFLLTLLEEPPLALFQEKLSNISMHGKPFAPLVPPSWAAICLAYVREMELLSNKKKESTTTKPKNDKPVADSPSPRRKPRFPKKPKAAGDPAGQ